MHGVLADTMTLGEKANKIHDMQAISFYYIIAI